MQLLFVTNNSNKLKEANQLLHSKFEIKSLAEINFTEEIPEPYNTLEENAIAKINFVKAATHFDCFADDSGLLIEALNDAPGVHSARFAGNQKNDTDNMNKVLELLKNESNRKAKFVTVIALYFKNTTYTFKGEITGTILHEKCGDKGFGYDPIFMPDGLDKSFAQIDLDQKNALSHRAKALQAMSAFLLNENI